MRHHMQIGNNFTGTYVINQGSQRSMKAIDNEAALVYLNEAIAESIGSTILKTMAHKFAPIGVTAISIISESHISIHSFPEFCRITVDIFCCNCQVDLTQADVCIRKLLDIESGSFTVVERF